MKSDDLSSGIDRRALVSTLVLLPALSTALLSSPAQGQTTLNAPLASWNERPAKQAIVDFVRATTQQGSPGFVVPEDRIATFDQDGTLWTEHPIYTQAMFALDRVRAMAPQHLEWQSQEPFKAVLSNDPAALGKFTERDWFEIVVFFNAGATTE